MPPDALRGAAAAASVADAERDLADLHEYLLGRAHGANAVRHPGTPTRSLASEEDAESG